MLERPDLRYRQKIANYSKALKALERSVSSPIREPRDLSGIIKDFEIAYELSWKSLKAFLDKQGHFTTSAKDVYSQAYQLEYLGREKVWLDMIQDRNLTVHTYDVKLAKALYKRIRRHYVSVLQALLPILKST